MLEDDFGDFDAVFRALRKIESFEPEIVRARTIVEARQATARQAFDVALVDYHLGADSGLVFLQENGGRIGGALTILLTGATDGEVHRTALDAGAILSLNKRDLSTSLLETTIRSARHTRELEQRLQTVIAAFGLGQRSQPEVAVAPGSFHAGLHEMARRAEAIRDAVRSFASTDLDAPWRSDALNNASAIAHLARELAGQVGTVERGDAAS